MTETKKYLRVSQIDYIRYLRAHLNHCGAWPTHENEKKGSALFSKIKRFLYFVLSVYVLVQIIAILKVCREKVPADVYEQCIVQVAIMVSTVQRYSIPLFPDFIQYLDKLLTETHLYHFKNKSEYAMKIYNKVNRICIFAAITAYVALYAGITLAQFGEIFSNYNDGLFTTDPASNASIHIHNVVCIYIPYSMYSNLFYVITLPMILYLSIMNCAPIMNYDLVLFVSLATLWGHVKILKHDLATFPRPEMEKDGTANMRNPAWYSKEESVMVRKRLVAMIDHHRLMKEFSRPSSDIYGMMLLCYYAALQFMQITLMLQLQHLSLESFCKLGVLALLSFQLLTTVSVSLELLTSESETLWTAVYDLPWECMNVSNRRLVFFFMCNTQKNMGFKAQDLLDVGVKTAFSICKTSISCYLFLRTLQ